MPLHNFLTENYPENYFSHIIIDECHRSAWGKWSQVLTRNPNVVQVGLTATPRQIKELIFFTKGKPTERIWYYDLSDIKVGKKTPLSADRFDEFFRLLPTRGDSDRSWTVTREEIEAHGYDLKAVNPNAKANEDLRKPEELLDLIEAKGREVSEALGKLRGN